MKCVYKWVFPDESTKDRSLAKSHGVVWERKPEEFHGPLFKRSKKENELLQNAEISVIGLYSYSFNGSRKFKTAGRAFARFVVLPKRGARVPFADKLASHSLRLLTSFKFR